MSVVVVVVMVMVMVVVVMVMMVMLMVMVVMVVMGLVVLVMVVAMVIMMVMVRTVLILMTLKRVGLPGVDDSCSQSQESAPLSSKILEPVAGLFYASVLLPVARPPSPPHLELWGGGELLPSPCSPHILFSQAALSGCAVSLSTRVAWPGHP